MTNTRFAIGPAELCFIQRGWQNSNNILICDGNAPVIIDTGHFADVDETVNLIRQQGVDPTSLGLIVNTHCHWDHYGGDQKLQTLSNAPIAASKLTADIFARNDQRAMWLDYFGVVWQAPKVDITWQDGDVVELASVPFEIIAAPGHAPDAVALYQPDRRLLISADALHDGDCGVINVAVHGDEALDAAIATVQRFMDYDIDVALPGHGPLITDVTGSLQRLAVRLATFKRNPVKLAWHFVRRVTMAALLRMQPIARKDFVTALISLPWVVDFAPRCGYSDLHHFLTERIDEFLLRGLVTEDDGLLISLVPR